MSTRNKEDKLRGGISALFGNDTARGADTFQDEKEAQRSELIDSVDDTELREALRARQIGGRGRYKKVGRPKESSSAKYSTVCIKANTEKWEKVREISLRETLQIKEIVEIALDMLISKYESEAGSIDLSDKKRTKVFNKE